MRAEWPICQHFQPVIFNFLSLLPPNVSSVIVSQELIWHCLKAQILIFTPNLRERKAELHLLQSFEGGDWSWYDLCRPASSQASPHPTKARFGIPIRGANQFKARGNLAFLFCQCGYTFYKAKAQVVITAARPAMSRGGSNSIMILLTNFQRRPRDSRVHGSFFGLVNVRTAVVPWSWKWVSRSAVSVVIYQRSTGSSPAVGGINPAWSGIVPLGEGSCPGAEVSLSWENSEVRSSGHTTW